MLTLTLFGGHFDSEGRLQETELVNFLCVKQQRTADDSMTSMGF